MGEKIPSNPSLNCAGVQDFHLSEVWRLGISITGKDC